MQNRDGRSLPLTRREWLRLATVAAAAQAARPVEALGSTRNGVLSRADRLRTARVAPGPLPLTAEAVARDRTELFNAVFLSDIDHYDAIARRWVRVTPERIAAELAIAREFDLSVFVCIPAALPYPATSAARQPLTVLQPAARAGVQALTPGFKIEPVPAAEFQRRVELWSLHERGEIVGAFLTGDDPFHLQIPAELQREWYRDVKRVSSGFPVLGLTGEACLEHEPGVSRRFWAPDSFDHVLHQNYPFNLARIWNKSLDPWTSETPDEDLVAYENEYFGLMLERFFRDLRPEQIVVPLIQTFYYAGEPRQRIPRARDIELQVRLTNLHVRRTLKQRDNFSMAYFFRGTGAATTGGGPFEMPRGFDDVAEWRSAVLQANRALMLAERRQDRWSEQEV